MRELEALTPTLQWLAEDATYDAHSVSRKVQRSHQCLDSRIVRDDAVLRCEPDICDSGIADGAGAFQLRDGGLAIPQSRQVRSLDVTLPHKS